jgi:hypothetical protein
MTTIENPKGPNGETLCAWCGKGPVPPSRGTKPRAYCSRACVQRAYVKRKRDDEERKIQERVLKAYAKGRAEGAELRPGKSRDFARTGAGKSRDFPESDPEKSRDFPPKPQVTAPVPPAPRDPVGRRVSGAFGAAFLAREAGEPDGDGPPSRA